MNSLFAALPQADFVAPEIHWGAISPLLIVMAGGLLGIVIEAFVPQRSRGAIQMPLALVTIVAAFVALFALNAPFPLIVLAAGLIGVVGGRIAPQQFNAGGGHGTATASYGPAIIDDDTPPPAHARFSRTRLLPK